MVQESKSDAAFVADRAELLLKQAGRFQLKTRSQCLEHLGSHFRAVLGTPPRKTDYQVDPLHLYQAVTCKGGNLCVDPFRRV